MCVIVHQPTGAHLDKARAERLWKTNPDGGGFAYITDEGRIEIVKEMTFKKWWSKFEQARSANKKSDFLIHMRIKTHGTVTLDNVHPFQVDEHTVMAHNGILHGVEQSAKDVRSDTRAFVEDLLPTLPEDWLDNQLIVSMMEEWIGWSKLMFLTTNPKLKHSVYILNRKAQGTQTTDGMWFSNGNGLYEPKRQSIVSYGYSATDGIIKQGKKASPPLTFEEFLTEAETPPKRKRTMLAGPKNERAELEEQRREEFGIISPITYNYGVKSTGASADKGWECLGCEERVGDDGDCECWETLCLQCSQLTAECLCARGYSSNVAHYSQLKVEQLEQMLRVGEEIKARWDARKENEKQPDVVGKAFNGSTGQWEPIYSRASTDTWDW